MVFWIVLSSLKFALVGKCGERFWCLENKKVL